MNDQNLEVDGSLEMFRAVYDDRQAEINGRIYELTRTTHKKRRKIFAFFTKHINQINANDYSFMDSLEFDAVEKLINDVVVFEGSLISRLPDHWEKHPEDYVIFIMSMLGAMSYPFLKGVAGS